MILYLSRPTDTEKLKEEKKSKSLIVDIHYGSVIIEDDQEKSAGR